MTIAVATDPRLQLQDMAGIALRVSVGQPAAVEDAMRQLAFLRRAGDVVDHAKQTKLVLRNLFERRVGSADDTEYLDQDHVRNLRAAMGTGNVDATQAEAGEEFRLLSRQVLFAVAQRRFATNQSGYLVDGLQHLDVVPDGMCREQLGRLATEVLGCGFIGYGLALQRGGSANGIGVARLAGSMAWVERPEEGGEAGGNSMLAGHL